jgi:hypothetical protein
VVFSAADLARIEIPPFSRIEDQILGYCVKYWSAVEDPAFERILFLYSRKYGKKNYDVYMAIRRGQQAKHRDDEILASIMGVLVTGYYYSIQGDLYLQRNWNAIKHALANQVKAPAALPPPAPREQKRKEPKQIEAKPKTRRNAARPETERRKTPRPQAVSARPAAASARPARPTVRPPAARPLARSEARPPARSAASSGASPKIAPRPKSKAAPKIAPRSPVSARPAAVTARPARPAASKPVQIKTAVPRPVKVPYKLKPAPETKTVIVARAAPPARPVAAKPPVRPAAPPKPLVSAPPPVQKGYRPAPFVPPSPPRKLPRQKVFTNKTLGKAKGSVSDRLKQLSGRSYDVYQDRFLTKARASIRKILGTGRGLFFNLPEEAEDLVYNFLRDHYSDPYMDWEDSADRRNLLSMGFDLPSLHPVIDECYRTL